MGDGWRDAGFDDSSWRAAGRSEKFARLTNGKRMALGLNPQHKGFLATKPVGTPYPVFAAETAEPRRFAASFPGGLSNAVLTATRDREGRSVVLHVVNAAGEAKPLAFAGLGGWRLVRATTLASDDPRLDNPARCPDRIAPRDVTAAFAASATLPPYSYTVLVYAAAR